MQLESTSKFENSIADNVMILEGWIFAELLSKTHGLPLSKN